MTKTSFSLIQSEIKAFLVLAIPLVSAQVALGATGFVDAVMMGHLGLKDLAAGGLGSFTYQVFLYTLSGVVVGVGSLVAEAYGAEHKTQIKHVTQQGLWLTIIISISTMWLIKHMDVLMLQFGQSPEIVILADTYIDVVLWGLFPAVGFAMFRGVVSGLSQAHPIPIIVTVGTLFNIIGNYVLGFGKLGFPRMELEGLALASVLSWWGMFLALFIYILRHPQLKKYNLFYRWYRIRLYLLQELIIIGAPIGISIAFEYGLVLVITYLMGILGTDILAAHQIALQTAFIIFMIPLGMSYAATARIGQWFGRQNVQGIKRAGYVSISVLLVTTMLVMIAIIAFRPQVAGLFVNVGDPNNSEMLKYAIPMLIVIAIGLVVDGIQKTTLGALHGLQDTRIPLLISIPTYLGIGLLSSYVLCFIVGWGGIGLWIGYYFGAAMVGLFYILRFDRLIASKFKVLK